MGKPKGRVVATADDPWRLRCCWRGWPPAPVAAIILAAVASIGLLTACGGDCRAQSLGSIGSSTPLPTDAGPFAAGLLAAPWDDMPAPGEVGPWLQLLKQSEERLAKLEVWQSSLNVEAKAPSVSDSAESEPAKPKSWYDKYTISGYAQLRINETMSLEPGSAPAHHNGDSSVGDDQSFFLRRARIVISGDVTERISIYFQPEFAGSVPGSPDGNHFAQIRDWYADLHFDDSKQYRVRIGQSKVPYGWENLQSSRNRLPLDRNDALNSAVKNERDLGAYFYWTPEYAQDFFSTAQDDGLKGSGNFGVFGLGFYNGQGGSFQEQNDNLHIVSRLTWPITLANGQMLESGIQGYSGKYTVLSSAISPLGVGPAERPAGALETGNSGGIVDERLAASFIWYPQPLGFQSEWTVGRGPSLNDAQTEIVARSLYGGYAMVMYRYESECRGEIWPFARWTYYRGGYKSERNAPFAEIDEWELGVEWQATKNLEFVTACAITDRTNTGAIGVADELSYGQFRGSLLRFQLQVRF